MDYLRHHAKADRGSTLGLLEHHEISAFLEPSHVRTSFNSLLVDQYELLAIDEIGRMRWLQGRRLAASHLLQLTRGLKFHGLVNKTPSLVSMYSANPFLVKPSLSEEVVIQKSVHKPSRDGSLELAGVWPPAQPPTSQQANKLRRLTKLRSQGALSVGD